MENIELSEFPESEKKRFADEYKNQDIPTNLEEKTIRELRARGMFKGRFFSTYRYFKPALAFLLITGLFVAGFYTGRNTMIPVPLSNHDQYLLLLQNPAGFFDDGSHASEYGKWFDMLNDTKAQGEELQQKGWTVALHNGVPAVEAYNKIGPSGYFIIHASSEKEALMIASTCPHLKYNGQIEVRPVQNHN